MAATTSEGERPKTTATISKAINLFKNKHFSTLVDRHIRAINRIVTANKDGFLLKDLYILCDLLSILYERHHSNSLYVKSICQLVSLCGKPFLKERISDENTYAPQVVQTLSLLGQIAASGEDQIAPAVATAIASFYAQDTNQALLEGLQMTTVTYNAALIERSAVAKCLVEALRSVDGHDSRLKVLRTIHLLSATPTNCNHMLSQGLASLMCHVICYPDPNQQILFIGMEVLWNLMELGSPLQVGEQLSSVESMGILKRVFYDMMVTCPGKHARQLRNDMLIICLHIARLCPDAPFVETGFFSDLCTFATITEETGSRPHLQSLANSLKQLQLTREFEDYQLKKTLMCIVTTLSSDQTAVKIIVSKKVLRSLLSYVVQNDKAPENWGPAQFEELQLMALSCLCILAPPCIEDYMTCQGNTRILLLIEWCTKHHLEFKGHGNSFHGEGGRGNKVAQLRQSLRLLLSMCGGGDDGVIEDLHEQGAIPMLLGLLKHFISQPESEADSPVLLEMQSDILMILSCVCEMDMHRKELFGGYDGVSVLVSYLKRDISKFSSGLGHNRLLLAAVDCVWCTVVSNPMVEDIFLESEGALVLLDVLKVCQVNTRALILSVLVDLCENLKAIPHVLAWKGSDYSSSWSLLAQLWREEEKDMEVPRGEKSTLAGSLQPLMGAQQNANGVPPIPTHCPSAAITDVTENLRAKIYALCCKMGFQYPSEELSVEDRITLCIIESYLDFKSGEVWNEVAEELAQEGLRPVTPDQECLTEILHTHEEKAEETLKTQHELLDEQARVELLEETRFYDKVKEYHKTKENGRKCFDSLVKRTTNYQHLKEAKKKQMSSLDASRRSNIAIGNRFHALDQQTLNVTTFCGRHVTVFTTPPKLLTLPIVPSSHHLAPPPSLPPPRQSTEEPGPTVEGSNQASMSTTLSTTIVN